MGKVRFLYFWNNLILTISQTLVATIADECPTCNNNNSIDMSVALFQGFADLAVGLLPSKSPATVW